MRVGQAGSRAPASWWSPTHHLLSLTAWLKIRYRFFASYMVKENGLVGSRRKEIKLKKIFFLNFAWSQYAICVYTFCVIDYMHSWKYCKDFFLHGLKCAYRRNYNFDYGSFDTLKVFRPMSSLPWLRPCSETGSMLKIQPIESGMLLIFGKRKNQV